MAAWDALDDTSMACRPKGTPMAMTTPHPYEFVDDGDSIRILGHEFNIVRTIHMTEAGDPGTFVAGPAVAEGYWVALGESPEPYDCKVDD